MAADRQPVVISSASDDAVRAKPRVWNWCSECKDIERYFALLSPEEARLKYGSLYNTFVVHVVRWRPADHAWLQTVGIPAALAHLARTAPNIAHLLTIPAHPGHKMCDRVNVVRTRSDIEFGLPFTLCAHTIFCSRRPTVRTLVHELVHIIQRRHPMLMQRVYLALGWQLVSMPTTSNATRRPPPQGLALHNPDTASMPVFGLPVPDAQNGEKCGVLTTVLTVECGHMDDQVWLCPPSSASPIRLTAETLVSLSQNTDTMQCPAWQCVLRVRHQCADVHPNEVMAYDLARSVTSSAHHSF